MEKLSTLTKAAAWNLLGIMAGILLICSCSAQVNAQENQKYESVYADTLTVAGQKVALTVLLNPKDNAEGVIRIGEQDISISSQLAKDVGYAHVKATAYDFTGDGKEEIALVLSGGASGAFQAVQVFGAADGKWSEIQLPSDIYSPLPQFIKQQQKKLGMKMNSTLNYYRTVSFQNAKIILSYQILSDTDLKPVGEVRQELCYCVDKKQFTLGGTTVTLAKKSCVIESSANKKAIQIKWSTGTKKSSINGAQIKAATKKNMKNAVTYKLSKKQARKMSYQFTVKSGKVSANQNYYFKVKLKTGKTWTKWSNVEKAKINKK